MIKFYKNLIHYISPFKLRLILIFLVGLLSTPVYLLIPLPLKIAIDCLIGDSPYPDYMSWIIPQSVLNSNNYMIILLSGALLIFTILRILQGNGYWLLSTKTTENIDLQMRSRLFKHAQELSLKYHDSKGISELVYKIQYDAPAIGRIFIWGFIPLITSLFMLISMIVVISFISLKLALIAISISPIVVILILINRNRINKQWEKVKNEESEVLSNLQEGFSLIRVVKAFNREQSEYIKFLNNSIKSRSERIKVILMENMLSISVGLVIGIGTVLVLYTGLSDVLNGKMLLGNLILVMSYLSQLYDPLEKIGIQIIQNQGNVVSINRIISFLEQDPEIKEIKNPVRIFELHDGIEFSNVSFSYGNTEVLSKLNFVIEAGQKVGIVGKTGSGKTTILNLLLRFYEVSEGEIKIDGVNIKNYKFSDLRNLFSIVLQEPILFSDTIRSNISFSRPDAPLNQIIHAAKLSKAHEFIEKLPDKYEAKVGDKGMLLSGGERQRIALARAFLKNSPLLIMDEPTSSIDIKTEKEIVDLMNHELQDKTFIIVAHRINTLESCDLIINIEKNEITHKVTK